MFSKFTLLVVIFATCLITENKAIVRTYVRWERTSFIVGIGNNRKSSQNSPATGFFIEKPTMEMMEFQIFASNTGYLYSDYVKISSNKYFPRKVEKISTEYQNLTKQDQDLLIMHKRDSDTTFIQIQQIISPKSILMESGTTLSTTKFNLLSKKFAQKGASKYFTTKMTKIS